MTAPPQATGGGIPASVSVIGLVLLFGIDNLLVLRFLGIGSPLLYVTGGVLLAALCLAAWRGVTAVIPARRWAMMIGVAAVIMLLGGQGRLFYANLDWQVRDAAIADMARWPWPFLYVGHGEPLLLRAPIGSYLLPALAGKAWGTGGVDIALLIQSSFVLGSMLALGSLLVEDFRSRIILLCVVIVFSGMDTIGEALLHPDRLWPFTRHIEGWLGVQYSSLLTVAFWAPQHGISGWAGALFFLLWRRRIVPLGLFLAMVPLVAIWSPLGVMGTMPFVLFAGLDTVIRRRLRIADVLLPLASVALAAIPLQYLGAGSGHVGAHWLPLPLVLYTTFEVMEALPYLIGVWLLGRQRGLDIGTFGVVAACLLLFPFISVGTNVDFQMRASIPALAILAVLVAEALARPPLSAGNSPWRGVLIATLLVGALTPAREVARAILYRAAPLPRCDLWQSLEQSFAEMGKETYYARLHEVPPRLRGGSPTPAPPLIATRCWSRDWQVPR